MSGHISGNTSGQPAPAPTPPGSLLGTLKSWLKAHSGSVSAMSELLAPVPDPQPRRFSGAVRVLVADDDPVNLMVISAQLESRGLVPLLAADGAEAAALACGLDFDLVLMDLQMPVLDGLDATAAIRRFEAESHRAAVPVIAYTSMSPAHSVLLAHGFNGTLHKPCDEQDLNECLVRWCPTYSPAAPARAGRAARQVAQATGRSPGRGSGSPR